MKPTIRFGPNDEGGFGRAERTLIADYEAMLQERGATLDVSIAQLMLEYRWAYGDGRILWWTTAEIEAFLLDFVPRKTAMGTDDALLVPGDLQGFITWLSVRGLLGGDSLDRLTLAIADATPAFLRAMAGDDLDLEGPDDAPEHVQGPMPAVELPPVEELAAMAKATATFRLLRTVRDFLETPRRLTQAGNLSVADARELATQLGIDHRFDPVVGGRAHKTRSVMDVPELDRAFRWTILARFGDVERNRAELGPNAELFETSPQEAWLLAMVTLLNGKVLDGDIGWLPFEEPLVDLLEELPVQLYPDRMSTIRQLESVAVQLLEEDRTLDPPGGPIDERRWIVESLPKRVLEPLVDLGMIELDVEDETVRLSPLGRWGIMAWLRAQGIDAPIIGELADAPAAEVLAWCHARTQEEAEAELRAWIAKRPVTAAHEIAMAARAGAPAVEAMFAFEIIGPEAETAVRGLLEDDRLAGPALVWLVDQELLDPDSLATDDLLALMTESLLQVLEDEGPQEMAEHMALQGPIEEQLRLVDALAQSDHPRTRELLTAIGKHHPMKPVAKHARSVAFKRSGLQVH